MKEKNSQFDLYADTASITSSELDEKSVIKQADSDRSVSVTTKWRDGLFWMQVSGHSGLGPETTTRHPRSWFQVQPEMDKYPPENNWRLDECSLHVLCVEHEMTKHHKLLFGVFPVLLVGLRSRLYSGPVPSVQPLSRKTLCLFMAEVWGSDAGGSGHLSEFRNRDCTERDDVVGPSRQLTFQQATHTFPVNESPLTNLSDDKRESCHATDRVPRVLFFPCRRSSVGWCW